MSLFIFDFDGTISDSKSIMRIGFSDFSVENNLPKPNVEEIIKGYTNPDFFDFGWGVDKKKQFELMDKGFDMINERVGKGIYTAQPYPNAVKIIEKIYNKGHKLAICTASNREGLTLFLKRNNIFDFFSVLKVREDMLVRKIPGKPAPDLLLEIIDELQVNKSEVYMIGDTDADIGAGKNAKIKTIGVTWGYFDKDRIVKTNPDEIVDDFMEIEKFI